MVAFTRGTGPIRGTWYSLVGLLYLPSITQCYKKIALLNSEQWLGAMTVYTLCVRTKQAGIANDLGELPKRTESAHEKKIWFLTRLSVGRERALSIELLKGPPMASTGLNASGSSSPTTGLTKGPGAGLLANETGTS